MPRKKGLARLERTLELTKALEHKEKRFRLALEEVRKIVKKPTSYFRDMVTPREAWRSVVKIQAVAGLKGDIDGVIVAKISLYTEDNNVGGVCMLIGISGEILRKDLPMGTIII